LNEQTGRTRRGLWESPMYWYVRYPFGFKPEPSFEGGRYHEKLVRNYGEPRIIGSTDPHKVDDEANGYEFTGPFSCYRFAEMSMKAPSFYRNENDCLRANPYDFWCWDGN